MSRYDQPVPEGKDPVLWDIARKRASFKSHFITYLIINAFLWGIWYFTKGQHEHGLERWASACPIWTTLGWGIGIAFHYAGAYINPKSNAVQKEYDKLANQQKNQQ